MDIPIIFQDKDIIICTKPVGVQSENDGMPALLSEQLGVRTVLCVHRLDTAVGGLMVYALNSRAAASLSKQISGREFVKQYYAVVQGRPEEDSGVLRDLLFRDRAKNKSYVVSRKRAGVKDAELEYRTVKSAEKMSLLDITLHTGRTHQIRVQFSSRAMPLVGDVKYGSKYKSCPIALWSRALTFRHPISNEPLHFEALPENTFPWNTFLEENTHEIY